MTDHTNETPTVETVVVKAATVNTLRNWPNYIVGLVALIITAAAFFTTRADMQRAELEQDRAECHTALMNQLHSELGIALYEHPDNPQAGVEKWPDLFREWQEQLPTCH